MFDWIVALVERLGALGVAFLMLLENVFPPIPSEIVLPLAGYTTARSNGSLAIVIAAGTIGSVAGASVWYWIGLRLGVERLTRFAEHHGRWLTLTPDEVRQASDWFDRHGRWTVLVGRMVPGVRSLISVPAGVARMPLAPFLLLTTLGSLLWTTALAFSGYMLGENYTKVGAFVEPASNVVLGLILAWYLYRVAMFDRGRPRDRDMEAAPKAQDD